MKQQTGRTTRSADRGIVAPSSGLEAACCMRMSNAAIHDIAMPEPTPTEMRLPTKSIGIGTSAFAQKCRSLDSRSTSYRFLKRAIDIAFSACVILLGLIPCAALSIAIAIDTKGSPIYTQERVGRLGRTFRIYKFRTMVADADNVEKYLDEKQLSQWRCERKVNGDPRISKLGRVLRRSSLDEIPQFLNVLAGQMSIVGPRAITDSELHHFGAEVCELLSVPQGITGAWQVGARNGATFVNGERQRLEIDYVRNASLSEDARICLSTFGVMFARRSGR